MNGPPRSFFRSPKFLVILVAVMAAAAASTVFAVNWMMRNAEVSVVYTACWTGTLRHESGSRPVSGCGDRSWTEPCDGQVYIEVAKTDGGDGLLTVSYKAWGHTGSGSARDAFGIVMVNYRC